MFNADNLRNYIYLFRMERTSKPFEDLITATKIDLRNLQRDKDQNESKLNELKTQFEKNSLSFGQYTKENMQIKENNEVLKVQCEVLATAISDSTKEFNDHNNSKMKIMMELFNGLQIIKYLKNLLYKLTYIFKR